MSETFKKYQELTQKVDEFFEDTLKKHRDNMQCAVTCSSCCKGGLTVTRVEAMAIKTFIQEMPVLEQEGLRVSSAAATEERCAALNAKGQCQVYAARPLVCRSHGVPIKKREEKIEEDGTCTECVLLEVCHLNFTHSPKLDELDENEFLDQETMSTILGTIDTAFSDERGKKRGKRFRVKKIIDKTIND